MSASAKIYTELTDLQRLRFSAHGYSFTAAQPVNSILAGNNVSKLRGRGLNFEELRHYRPGDDIRAMDWKVTRRTGKPHIKVYTEERERNIYLLVDQRQSMFFGSQDTMKSVMAAEVAALIAWTISETGDRLGALVFNDQTVNAVTPRRGKPHVLHVLNTIVEYNHALAARYQEEDASDSINKPLTKVNQLSHHNGLVIIITDGIGWTEQSTTLVKNLRRHNEVIACHIYDPLEINLPHMENMVVSDGEKQIQFSSKDQKIRSDFSTHRDEKVSAFTLMAKKYRIPVLPFSTDKASDKQLRKMLGG